MQVLLPPPPHLARLLGSLILLCLLAFTPARAADTTPAVPWDSSKQGAFVTALCADHQGRVFTATEGSGVWRFDPAASKGNQKASQYTHFTQKDGLGSDDVYALTVDANNRLWAGTLHGVSVFNGKDWKTYGPLEGLAGFRVFALAVCPTDHSVWVATEAGLSRWVPKQDRWLTYSRLDGLPSDALSSLAFNKSGDLFVGTQADGLATATAASGYKQWRVIPGPRETPHAAGGAGLPTGLINCLLVSSTGTVYAGTDDGLARSEDGGKNWRFLRGVDWKAKAEGVGATLVDNADVRALEVLPLDAPTGKPVRINAGGKASGEYRADADFDGGRTFQSNAPIDTKAVPNSAPQDVYRTARWGSFTYTIPNLIANGRYKIHLHLAEVAFTDRGRRVFSVSINGQPALTNFDIFAEAGGLNKALVREFTAQADGQGRLVLAFQGVSPLPSRENVFALAEDYVTCLAEDGAGHLLVGHRQQGLEAFDLKTGARVPGVGDGSPADFVTALLPRPDGTVLVGGYGAGQTQIVLSDTSALPNSNPSIASAPDDKPAPLPSPAKPPTLVELNALLKTLSAVRPDPNEMKPKAVALADDWQTEGDWLGRYGRYWACLCAMSYAPLNYIWGAGWENIKYRMRLGPNHRKGDNLRSYVTWPYTTNPKSLEMPPTYLDSRVRRGLTTWAVNRRQSEADDHGETYGMDVNGLGLYCTITVPKGLFYLSVYDFNKDNHDDHNRWRDYRISLRTHVGRVLEDNRGFASQPELAHARIRDFWGGVWKRFLVRGPQVLTVQVGRNNSYNTILPAVMLDLADENPPPYFQSVKQWQVRQVQENKQRQALTSETKHEYSRRFAPATSAGVAAKRLLDALQQTKLTNAVWWSTCGRRFYGPLMRWYAGQEVGSAFSDARLSACLATCYYQMNMYPQWEEHQRRVGLTPARQVEKALRWDGVTNTDRDYDVVISHMSAYPKTMNSNYRFRVSAQAISKQAAERK